MSHVDDGALHAYLDGELASVERTRLEAHVAECAACRARLDEERALIERASRLLDLAQPPAPERAAPPLHQLRQPRLLWRLRMPLAWAATVVLAVGLGYYAGGSSFAGRRAPVSAFETAPPVSETLRDVAAAQAPANQATERVATRSADKRAARPETDAPTTGVVAQAEKEKAAEPLVIVDGSLYGARADSAAAAAGRAKLPDSLAAAPRVEIRGAEPRPVPAAPAPTVDRAAAQNADELVRQRGRLVATEWPIIRRDPARQLLGTDPVGVPGLAVRQMRRSPAGDGVVLVEQVVDSNTVIQLYQRRVEQVAARAMAREAAPSAAAPERPAYANTERLARFIGPLRVEIAGPLTPDSLNKLLEQLKPLP